MKQTKRSNRLTRLIAAITAAVTMMCLLNVTAIAANVSYTVNVSGTSYYDLAQEMLRYVNEERTSLGLGTLTMDKELTAAAMRRAAEITVHFDHTRPNGSSCYSALPSKMTGENIAAGNSTASATFTQWKNSQGHYENMIRSSFKSIGIGVTECNGIRYWVQCFAYQNATETETSTAIVDNTYAVDITEDSCTLQFNYSGWAGTSSIDLTDGQTYQLEVDRKNSGWSYAYCTFDAGDFNWKSSDTSVATVSDTGLVTGVGTGTAFVTASAKSGSGSVEMKVNCKKSIEDAVIDPIPNYDYTGSAITPKPAVKYKGQLLTEGTDYTLSYSSNVGAGESYVNVIGAGSFSGTKTVTFTIDPIDISDKAKFSFSDLYVGDMNAMNIAGNNISVTYNGTVLNLNRDYYIGSASTNYFTKRLLSAGIVFGGNYKGSVLLESLEAAEIRAIDDQEWTGEPIVPKIEVYPSNSYFTPITEGKDYTYTIENNTDVGTATITVTGKGRFFGSFTSTFNIVEPIKVLKGDTDGNGIINMKDYALLQRYLNGFDVTVIEVNADMNDDGKINMKDYAALQFRLNNAV